MTLTRSDIGLCANMEGIASNIYRSEDVFPISIERNETFMPNNILSENANISM